MSYTIYKIVKRYEYQNRINLSSIGFCEEDRVEKEIERWLGRHKDHEMLVDLDNLKVIKSSGLIHVLEIQAYK